MAVFSEILKAQRAKALSDARKTWESELADILSETLCGDTLQARPPHLCVWACEYLIDKGITWDTLQDSDDVETLRIKTAWFDNTVTFRFRQTLQDNPDPLWMVADDPKEAAERIIEILNLGRHRQDFHLSCPSDLCP